MTSPANITPNLQQIMDGIEQLWPASLAESWDAVGLVAGRPDQEIRKIIWVVDPSLPVVEDAVQRGADLIISHHPLMLKPVNGVSALTPKGRVIHTLIENQCALLTAHTNGDSAVGGVSDVLADILGLEECVPLTQATGGLPEEGIGRVGYLVSPTTLGDFAGKVYGILPKVAGGVRVSGPRDAIVSRVAICGGAGDSLFDAVRSANADVYVTADLRHHPALEAKEATLDGRPYLVDVSHFASEWMWLPAAAQSLINYAEDSGWDVEIMVSNVNSDPWDFCLNG
ncbi:dinuclear metal center YbgI/SA1388 family protein [Neomicrococcus aestuarii]|uniref:GTP cyclohydrolase 1 type 2 homolog n=1 Tax=Neomicrococcus aestuarii TaxID=556325 RepID=A0A7W8WZB0_9MICC|nr:Nif3-like dinuclear metal center hexameric protein [Neomicrococcus aestuarii]MBB5512092.1 dinuclear metal center YbgI/SA1388 family protein [Neomicrococcus aestuarii]